MIEKFKQVHGDKYDYSEFQYINARTKCAIICPKHGKFQQLARKHAMGQGCPKCAAEHTNDYRILGTEEFIKRATAKHGGTYDYSKSQYVNSTTKVQIICRIHGPFYQNPHSHVKGRGCPKCKTVKDVISRDDIVNQAVSKHNGLYSYGNILGNKIEIICKEHGKFISPIRQHLLGSGCKKCHHKRNKHKKDIEYYIGRIPYETVSINQDEIILKCKKHGEFSIKSSNVKNGASCKQCAYERLSQNNSLGIKEFVDRSSAIHSNKYDYSNVQYINQDKKVCIICPNHGEFYQSPKKHMSGQGCKACSISRCQLYLFNSIKDVADITINDRYVIYPYEIDLFLKDFRLGIEVDGIYYHSFNRPESRYEIFKHRNKQELASSNGIFLMRFREDEILRKHDIVVSIIKHRLGLSHKIQARKCYISDIGIKEYRKFMDDNHLAGYKYAKYIYGLRHQGELVQVISFDRHNKYEYEVVRSATLRGKCVVGGLSKLVKHFVKITNPNSIMTYCDARYNKSDGYIKSGFRPVGITKPNYFYVKGDTVRSRQCFQKHKLKDILPIFDKNITEYENMFLNGYRRLWDCGNYKLIWYRDTK